MAQLTRGQTFGTTEQITNTKLHNLVDLGAVSSINSATDLAAGFLQSMPSAAGKVPPQNMWNDVTMTTNASQPSVSLATALLAYASTYCSLATFVGARVGQQFRMISQQASFPTLIDTGNFKLNGNFIPAKQYDNITLYTPDGITFVELARTLT